MSKFGNYTTFIVFDYSQIEVRMFAHMSGDKNLLKVFNSGEDIHCAVGHDLTGEPAEHFSSEHRENRTFMKALHFAMLYGKRPKGLREQLEREGISRTIDQVQSFYDKYFAKYPGAKRLIDKLIDQASEEGFVSTIFGFKREIMKVDDERASFWGNQAVNSPVQGSAHQLVLIALAAIYLKPKTYWAIRDLREEVHDAIYSFTLVKNMQEAYEQGKYLLEKEVPLRVKQWFGFELKVPLIAEAKAGFRQGVLVDYKGESVSDFLDVWREKNKKIETKMRDDVKKHLTTR